jgi:hypothetical protein
VCLIRLAGHSVHRNVHVGAHVLAMSFCPAAHTSQRNNERFPESAQRILDGDGLRSCHAPRDQSSGLEMTKSFRKHALRDLADVPAQLPMSMWSLSKRKQDPGGPPADEDRTRQFRFLPHSALRSRCNLLLGAHKINLGPEIETVGVTSVAGFRLLREQS